MPGKVRELYDAGDDLLVMVASDRISAFDVVLAEPIPDKGRVLTAMTVYWLDLLADLAPSHLVSADPADLPPDAAAHRGRRRPGRHRRPGHARAPGRDAPPRVHRPRLPGRLGLGRVRAVGHPARHAAAGRAPSRPSGCPSRCSPRRPRPPRATTRTSPSTAPSTWWARRRPSRPATSASRPTAGPRRPPRHHGIIMADTKFELGLIDGRLALCDEVLTPDSSRFWPADQLAPGDQPAVVRQAAGARLAGGHRLGQAAAARRRCPAEVVAATSERYVTAYERISGRRSADWYGAERSGRASPGEIRGPGGGPAASRDRRSRGGHHRAGAARPRLRRRRGRPGGQGHPLLRRGRRRAPRPGPRPRRCAERLLANPVIEDADIERRGRGASVTTRIGVVVFPGTNCEHDVVRARIVAPARGRSTARPSWSGTATTSVDRLRRRRPPRWVRPRRLPAARGPGPLLAGHGGGDPLRGGGRAGDRDLQRLPGPHRGRTAARGAPEERGPALPVHDGARGGVHHPDAPDR